MDYVDFFELYASPQVDYAFLAGINKPITIHIAHFASEVNFANPRRREINEAAFRHALVLADKFSAKKIIFHPELKEDDDCSVDVLANFITNHYDERLHLENMPFSSEGFEHFAASPPEIEALLDLLGVKFCFDFAHAFEFLEFSGKGPSEVEEFLKLNPSHFHITDTDLSAVVLPGYNEQHINFGEGTMDLVLCRNMVPQGAWVTIETPMSSTRQLKEVQFLYGHELAAVA